MPAEYSPLAALLRRRMAELNNLSTYEVARRAGNRVSNGTVWNIINDRVRDVKKDTLRTLAHALGLPEEEVFAADRGKKLAGADAQAASLLNLFQALPITQQEDLIDTARMLHQRYGLKTEEVPVKKKHKTHRIGSKP